MLLKPHPGGSNIMIGKIIPRVSAKWRHCEKIAIHNTSNKNYCVFMYDILGLQWQTSGYNKFQAWEASFIQWIDYLYKR